MARRWAAISWSGRTGSLNGGSPTLAVRRRDVRHTGQAEGKGRSGKVQATDFRWMVAPFPRLCFPPEGAGGIAMQEI